MNDDLTLERVPTGIPGLDTILRGGLLKGGAYIVEGVPGAGKTVLANQICFARVARGGRAVFATLLAESHSRMQQHLRGLAFYDDRAIPASLTYVSALRVLEEDGLKGLADLLRREIRSHSAEILVVDGLLAAEQAALSEREFKKFVAELQAHAAAQDCTVLLLTNATGRSARAEETMVDGLILLGDALYGARAERNLEIRKFRGSRYLRGRHAFRITDEGIVVYPRFEAFHVRPSRVAEVEREHDSSGVDGLDAMLKGGLPAASTTALIGPSGCGKTTLGLHFLSRSKAEEPGLLFGFFETPARIRAKARALGFDLDRLLDEGALEILWQAPTEAILDALAYRLLEAVRARGVKRLFLDGLGGFMVAAVAPERMGGFFAALANELRAGGVSTLWTMETRDPMGSKVLIPVDNISSLIENLVFLRFVEQGGQLHRVISVLKARDSDFDPTIRRFEITGKGIAVDGSFVGAEDVMSGFVHRPGRVLDDASRRPQPSGEG
jgi:circadian clock protein KaiC